MVQHVILAQLVALPLAAVAARQRVRVVAPLAWVIGIAVMIGTSSPPAYLAAQRSATYEWTSRLALLVAGVIFWTPLFGGTVAKRLGPGAALTYLITACFATTLAGIYLAFSAVSSDQQVAGLIMWVPCCVVYLSASLAVVVRAMSGIGSVKAAADPSSLRSSG
jgi:cytochrome c oxidase assembly factor CtaG